MNLDLLVREIREESPALVLIDIELPGQLIAVAACGLNVAAWTDMFSLWARPGLPPLHLGTVPGEGFLGTRVGIAVSWLRFRASKLIRFVRLRIALKGGDQLSTMRRIADSYGFPLRGEMMRYQWQIPFVFRTIPTLVFNAAEIEFPHTPRSNVEYVGPAVDPHRTTGRKLAPSDRQRLDKILYATDRTGDRALIYVAFGAWHKKDDSELITRVVEAIARNSDWEAIVSLGDREGVAQITTDGPNVHMFEWVPQTEVLAAADVAIHHGGVNTINECVMTSTPMLVYPFDYRDTPGSAARVAYHGIGVVGNRALDDPDQISVRVERLLADEEITRSVAELRDHYLDYLSSNTAAVAIERLINDSASG